MSTFNQITLVGNVTRDPESRSVTAAKGQTTVTDFSIAVNNPRKKDDTMFVDIVTWGRLAETAATYLKKGSSVLVAGRLAIDSYEKDGEKRKKTRVVCDNFQLLGGKRAENGSAAVEPAAAEAIEDEIPF